MRYYWKQCYGMADGVYHWALCDDESQKEGKVSCAYMVLLADNPNGIDGKPVGEQFMPARIIDALNTHASHLARIEALERALTDTLDCYEAYQKADAAFWEDFDGDKLREEELQDAKTTTWEHMEFAVQSARLALAPAAGKGGK